MQIFNMYKNLPLEASGAVVAIGNFDGVHKGHQALLAKAKAIAKDGKLAVLTLNLIQRGCSVLMSHPAVLPRRM
jgi:FAD synthase